MRGRGSSKVTERYDNFTETLRFVILLVITAIIWLEYLKVEIVRRIL